MKFELNAKHSPLGLWTLPLLLFAACTAALGQSPEGARLELQNAQLIRCSRGSDVPCVRFDINVLDSQGHTAPLLKAVDKETVRVIQTRPVDREYKPFFVGGQQSGAKEQAIERCVLVLFDVSGSMNDPVTSGGRKKFEIAREAVSTVLGSFQSGSDRIAVVPFESHGVIRGISSAVFESNIAEVERQLRSMPVPSPKGNTALYAAISAGLDLLLGQDSRFQKLLIVFTDGKNDLRPGDDPKLEEFTLDQVTEKARKAQIATYTIGLGNVSAQTIDEPAMRQIAYPDASHYIPADDSESLRAAFKKVIEQFFSRIRVTTRIDEDSLQKLTGADRRLFVRFLNPGGGPIDSREFVWSSPVSGTPDTALFADATEVAALQQTAKETGVAVREGPSRGIIQASTLVFFIAMISFLWFIPPRWLWPAAYGRRTSALYDEEHLPPQPVRYQQAPTRGTSEYIQDPSTQGDPVLDNGSMFDRSPSEKEPMAPQVPATEPGNEGTLTRFFGKSSKPSSTDSASSKSGGLTEVFKEKASAPIRPRSANLTSVFTGQSRPATPPSTNDPRIAKSSGLTDIFRPTAGSGPPTESPSLPPRSSFEPRMDVKPAMPPNSLEPRWPDSETAGAVPSGLSTQPPKAHANAAPGDSTNFVSRTRKTTLINTSSANMPPGRTRQPEPPPPMSYEPEVPRTPAPPPPVAPERGFTPNTKFLILLVFNAVFLIGAALVLYFVLKK